ncbi:mannose-1-phosphate guanylyltransferase [bacterium]|jgi:mannose-1-phosphate guanylyltransferase|nr:mannose-1-phosphate guanylyltransferase [bacterium]MBT6293244.1 mannose-1-phosphate guanylyltransferase [bacterium]
MKFLILAGGHGKRLWPLSDSKTPKQFQSFIGNKTLLQLTYDRLSKFGSQNIFISTNQRYKSLVLEQLPKINEDQVICEPEKRDNGPSVAVCMSYLKSLFGEEETVSISHADHLVKNELEFQEKLQLAHETSKKHNKFTIVQVKAKSANPNLGYVKIKDLFEKVNDSEIYTLEKFIEKPDQETAEKFLESYKYLWNTGYFVWPIKKFFEELKTTNKDVFELCEKINNFQDFSDTYSKMPVISIDYMLIEKVNPTEILIIPSDLGWSDIGTWQTLFEESPKDKNSNLIEGQVLSKNNQDTLIINKENGKQVVAFNLNDLTIVNTKDKILICPTKDAKDLKNYIKDLDNNLL